MVQPKTTDISHRAKFRERRKAEKEALQQKTETLLKQKCEIESQVRDLQCDIKVVTEYKELVMQENARLSCSWSCVELLGIWKRRVPR